MDEVTSGTLEADIAQERGGKGRKHQPYLYEVRLITCVWDSLWVYAEASKGPGTRPTGQVRRKAPIPQRTGAYRMQGSGSSSSTVGAPTKPTAAQNKFGE
jgi:hypothetical protein